MRTTTIIKDGLVQADLLRPEWMSVRLLRPRVRGSRWFLCSARLTIFAGLLLSAMAYPGFVSTVMAQQTEVDDGAFAMGSQGRLVRGTVTAATADHLSVKTEGGDTFQVTVTTNTRMMKERQPLKIADIHVGDGVGAMGVLDAPTKTVHAAALFVIDAAQVKKLREDMGKTYITGKVMAIDELELTVHRPDGVTQKITVDEGTSFKRGNRRTAMAMRGNGMADSFGAGDNAARGGGSGPGGPGPGGGVGASGESITLADIKVGDMIGGPGGVKGGVFVPTELTVVDAAAMARRRRPEGGASGQSPAGVDQH